MKAAPSLPSRTRAFVLFACFTALGLVACGPQVYIVQQYDGPVRDSETIAILRINGADSTRIVTLDGELADPRIAEDARLHIEMLPGRHDLRVADLAAPEAGSQRVTFEAEPGRIYRAVLESSRAKVFEVDRGSDQALREVTPALAEPRPASVAPGAMPGGGLPPVIAPEPVPSTAPPVSPAESAPAPVDPTTPPQP